MSSAKAMTGSMPARNSTAAGIDGIHFSLSSSFMLVLRRSISAILTFRHQEDSGRIPVSFFARRGDISSERLQSRTAFCMIILQDFSACFRNRRFLPRHSAARGAWHCSGPGRYPEKGRAADRKRQEAAVLLQIVGPGPAAASRRHASQNPQTAAAKNADPFRKEAPV